MGKIVDMNMLTMDAQLKIASTELDAMQQDVILEKVEIVKRNRQFWSLFEMYGQ